MTETSDRDRERAEEEAAVWLVRLSEAPEDIGLREGFEAWRTASELNAEIWARTARAYDLVGKAAPRHREHWQTHAAAPRRTRNRAAGDLSRPPPRPQRRFARLSPRRLGIGAAAALALCLVIALAPDMLLRAQADMVTATAEVRSAVLEDGSRLLLAPQSAVALRFADGAREVRLIEGEAFFEVVSDAAAPFRVVAGDSVTTVLGTAFEVRRMGDAEQIAVQHGRVRVALHDSPSSSATALGAGEWLRIAETGEPLRGRRAPDDVAAWRRGELIARDRPVSEIVDVLRRYHSGAILLQDQAFAAQRVSGIYDLRNPAKALEDLAAAHGARLTEISPWLLVVTAR